MSRYSVHVLDVQRNVVAVLENASQPRYSRRPRTATQLRFTLPRGDEKLAHLQRGALIEIWREDVLEISGRVEIRDVSSSTIIVTAYTEEIMLKDYHTPSQYGSVFNNTDCADVIRNSLLRWRSRRIKNTSQWEAVVESYQVEAQDVGSGTLWLARDGNGAYHRSGYAVYQFEAIEFGGFVSWDRIRWASDYPADGLVFTTVQYRYGTSGPWIPETSWPSCEQDSGPCGDLALDESPQLITGERGVLTDQFGLPLNGNSPILQVRVNLYTDDQTSVEDDEEGTSGSSPIFYALEVIARAEGPITAGTIPAETGVTAVGITADETYAFDVIRQACEQAEIDFEVLQGELSVAEAFGPDLDDELNLVTG